MSTKLRQQRDPVATSHPPAFHVANRQAATATSQPAFFKKTSNLAIPTRITETVIQRQENDKDPLTEGLKTTGTQLLKNPEFKLWYQPKLAFLKDTAWTKQPTEVKAALIAYGVLSLGTAGFAFSQNSKMRDTLSGVNIGTPLGWIPYSPIEGFTYTLPNKDNSDYTFSTDFTLNPYLELLSKRFPNQPWTGATLGIDTRYNADQGFSVSGGKFGLEFWGGGLNAQGKTFSELSPYPQIINSETPAMPPAWLMQSVPGLPPVKTGPGFEFMLSLDFVKLVNHLSKDK